MAVLPFGLWDVGETSNQAVDFEQEEEEQYEVEDVTKKCQFTVMHEECNMLHGKVMVVAIGKAANAFLEIYYNLPSKHVAEVIVKCDDDAKKSKNKDPCLLYHLGENLLCLMKTYIKAEDCSSWVETVLSAVKVEKLVILCSSAKSFYQGDEEARFSDHDILRHMKSSTLKCNTSVSSLEEGNLVKDIPAALFSYCEAFNLPAIMYINYTESHFIDVFSVKAYKPVLGDALVKTIPPASDSTILERLKRFEGIGVADNNLYM